jgi:predicted component of type VI protein secretion system
MVGGESFMSPDFSEQVEEKISKRFDSAQDFFSICAYLAKTDPPSDFPLHGKIKLRSKINLAFQGEECIFEQGNVSESSGALPIVTVPFLTLAGVEGPLPWWVTEFILKDKDGGGDSLHLFLDILNRRFWELLYIKKLLSCSPFYWRAEFQIAEILREMPFGLVGTEGALINQFSIQHNRLPTKIWRYCFQNTAFLGYKSKLANLLSDAIGCDVKVIEHQAAILPIANSARFCIGMSTLASSNSAIGSRSMVCGGILIRIIVTDSSSLNTFISHESFELVMRLVSIFYGIGFPPINVTLHCLTDKGFSELSAICCRVGRGAMLKTDSGTSQIIGPIKISKVFNN